MEQRKIRFSELVKNLGKPETVTLWSNPRENHSFMKAVKENRVLTLIQKPTGPQKDFGQIGFQPQPFAAFLVFPRPLPKDPGLRVIGIKYDSIEQPKSERPLRIKVLKLPGKVAKPPPLEKHFEVVIRRRATTQTTQTVTAQNETEAKRKALETVKQEPFDPASAEVANEIKSVRKT